MREESFKAAELCTADGRRRLSPHLLLPSTIMFGLTLGTIDSAGIERAGVPAPHRQEPNSSEKRTSGLVGLAGSEGCVGFEETLGPQVVGGVGNSVDIDAAGREGAGFGREAVGGDSDALISAVEEVKGIGGELEVLAVGWILRTRRRSVEE
jgi:hypothetical protein